MTSYRRIRWDPVVLGPPALALIAMLAMLMTISDPIHRVSAPAPKEAPRELRLVTSALETASIRPAASRPRRPSIREEMILAPPDTVSTELIEVWSPPLMVRAFGPLELRSIQAP
jgi:hypothetical protein